MTSQKDEFVFTPFKVTKVRYRGYEVPRPRSGHRIACDDTNIYCFGGYNPFLPPSNNEADNSTWTQEKPVFKEFWSFSIASRKWKRHKVVENMPDELASNAMCIYGKYLMIFGGTGAPFGEKCNSDVITWRISNGDTKFEILNIDGGKPPGQYGQSIICHKDHLYTIGGTNGFSYTCDIFRLDLRKLKWEAVFIGTGNEDEPVGRYRHEVACVDDKLYVIGGGTGEWAFAITEIPVFDLETKKWTNVTPKVEDDTRYMTITPLPRKCHSSVQINTPHGVQVFVVGGFSEHGVYNDIWKLDISTLKWSLMRRSVLHHALYFHSSTVTSYGCMYTFGGIKPKSNGSTRNNVMFKVWLCIPKLSEMCWEAILYYYPKIYLLDKKTLLSMGIPIHLVDRL